MYCRFNSLNLKIVCYFKLHVFISSILFNAMDLEIVSCPLCLNPHFESVDALRTSLIRIANSNIACPVCNEIFLGLDKLTIHLFSHISTNQHVDDCISTNEISKNFAHETKSLNTCDSTSINSRSLDLTQKNCIRCDICSYHFSDEIVLDLHQKLLHQTVPDETTGEYSYHCHLCSKRFKKRGSLTVHLRVVHCGFIRHNQNVCNCHDIQCRKQDANNNKSSNELVKNPKQKTTNSYNSQENKQWECDTCLKLFTTKYFLKKHKRLHTGEMPYFCTQCNKYFTFQQSYHKHMLYHSNDKPHVCTECGRSFKELSTLHNHQRIHSGERPFSCETCGKCFRQRVSYLVHRRIHTGAMPYKCTACNKRFRYKVSQGSHKCPFNPPGNVVRTQNLVYKLIENQKLHGIIEAGKVFKEDYVSAQLPSLTKQLVISSDVPTLVLPGFERYLIYKDNSEKTCSSNDTAVLQTINEDSLNQLLHGTTKNY